MLARLLLVCCAVSIAALPVNVRRGRPHKHLAASAFERTTNHDSRCALFVLAAIARSRTARPIVTRVTSSSR